MVKKKLKYAMTPEEIKASNIPILDIYKREDYWICEDSEGRTAKGYTKKHALNSYYVKYKIEPPKSFPVDISEYNVQISKRK